ncbi:hypothetical protein FOZ62_014770, partial [Perkinsus olseni]
RNFVARDADVELLGIFVFATADQQQLVEQFVSSIFFTQLDARDGGLHVHVRASEESSRGVLSGELRPKFWQRALEECVSAGPKAAVDGSTFVVFAEPDNLVFGGWLDDINSCMADRSSSICCMALGEGRDLCDDGLFALRCTQETIQLVRDVRQRMSVVEPKTLDTDRNVYAALNWGLKKLP